MDEYARKSSVSEIRKRFDRDVERFSRLETGQSATVDAPIALDLVARAAAAASPHGTHLLDVGCGAGNYTLKLLDLLPHLDVTLVDLSRPMLERVGARQPTGVRAVQQDIREMPLTEGTVGIVIAAAVLHHLRDDSEWRQVFRKLFAALRPGGSFWIFDLVQSSNPGVQQIMWERYGEYLVGLGGPEYRDRVFAYIEREDTPRPLLFQLDLLRDVGFQEVEVLHKSNCFAAFGGLKAPA